jgi:hypothetical protein
MAAPRDRAGVGLERPGEHLDQGRLPGAVLAEQAVHLTGADVEVDTVQRAHARERLRDPVHLQQRGRPTAQLVVHATTRTFAQH